jgi:hypothetical protein
MEGFMKKRLLLVVVAIVLVVAMCSSLVACANNGNTNAKPEDNGSSSFNVNGGSSASSTTKLIQTTSKASFELYSSEAINETVAANGVKVVNSETGAVLYSVKVAVIDSEGKRFKLYAPNGGYEVGGWYEIELTDSRLSFAAYENTKKVSMYIVNGNVNAGYTSSVKYSQAIYFSNFYTNNDVSYFEYNYASAGQLLSVGDVVLVEDDTSKEYAAYKITSVKDLEGGYCLCSYSAPKYNEIYETLEVSESAAVGTDGVVEFETEAIQEFADNLVSEALEFGLGTAKVALDAKLDGDTVKLSVKLTIPDVVDTADMVLTFKIDSKITADTDISLNTIVAAAKNGIDVTAYFDNTLTFDVSIEDKFEASESAELDDLINKVAAFIKGLDENDVEITMFTWTVPIGNGIADVSFDVKATANFSFSGKLGIESTSSVKFQSTVTYDPSAEDNQVSLNTTKPVFEFETVSGHMEGVAEVKVGLSAEIKFELLAGVLMLGIGADVGNYNRVYAEVVTDNLLESLNVNGGVYFVGGVYYKIKLLYGISTLKTGSIELKKDEIPLYEAGSKYYVNNIESQTITVSAEPVDLKLKGTQTDMVANTKASTDAVDLTFVSIVDTNGYVQLVDGKISLTEAGIAQVANQALKNYTVTVKYGTFKTTITVNSVATIDKNASDDSFTLTESEVGTSIAAAEAVYADGSAVVYSINDGVVTISGAKAGVIFIKVDGSIVAMVVVK